VTSGEERDGTIELGKRFKFWSRDDAARRASPNYAATNGSIRTCITTRPRSSEMPARTRWVAIARAKATNGEVRGLLAEARQIDKLLAEVLFESGPRW
jgi:hypothetical protein